MSKMQERMTFKKLNDTVATVLERIVHASECKNVAVECSVRHVAESEVTR